MKMKFIILLTGILLLATGCSSSWLEVKPEQSLVVPQKVSEYQAWLDNVNKFNLTSGWSNLETSADNFYLNDATFNSLSLQAERNIYTWASGTGDFYEGAGNSNWSDPYDKLLQANILLEGIRKVDRSSDPAGWDNVLGSTLFIRAFNHYALASVFCNVYDPADPLGIPLKTTGSPNEPMPRESLDRTYQLIISDLQEAETLLPVIPQNKMRPSRLAVWALLARIYLSMSDYDQALYYAESCIEQNADLIDYNSLNPDAAFPFDRFNSEVLYSSYLSNPSMLSQTNHIIDSNLYASYEDGDLRKQLFFRMNNGLPRFKGGYFGVANLFVGLALDEVYWVAMECSVRKGDLQRANSLFVEFMSSRWKDNDFSAAVFLDQHDALRIVLSERRKSLLFRCLRFMDIKRLNLSEDTKVTLRRKIGSSDFSLTPGDRRFVMPIPERELMYNDIQQNPR